MTGLFYFYKVYLCCSYASCCWIIFRTTFCMSIHHLIDIWIVSIFDTVINKAAVNINVPIFFVDICFLFYLMYTWSGIADSQGDSMFSFLKNEQTCFSKQLSNFTFPPTMYKGSSFFKSLPTGAIVCLFIGRELGCGMWYTTRGFYLHFPMINDVGYLFIYLLAIVFWRNIYSNLFIIEL